MTDARPEAPEDVQRIVAEAQSRFPQSQPDRIGFVLGYYYNDSRRCQVALGLLIEAEVDAWRAALATQEQNAAVLMKIEQDYGVGMDEAYRLCVESRDKYKARADAADAALTEAQESALDYYRELGAQRRRAEAAESREAEAREIARKAMGLTVEEVADVETVGLVGSLASHLELAEQEIENRGAALTEARQQLDGERGVLAMTVHRLGGIVEGRPTERVNFLQRIDELVAIERAHRPLPDSGGSPLAPFTADPWATGQFVLPDDSDVPLKIRQHLLRAASEQAVNLYWLLAIYRAGKAEAEQRIARLETALRKWQAYEHQHGRSCACDCHGQELCCALADPGSCADCEAALAASPTGTARVTTPHGDLCPHGGVTGQCSWCDLRDDGGLPEARPTGTGEETGR